MNLPIEQTVLETPRLVLRPHTLADAADLQRLAGAFEIADTTLDIPHPYSDGMAEEWIVSLPSKWMEHGLIEYAVTFRESGALIGGIGIAVSKGNNRAELGDWIAAPYWGQGYATKAAEAVLAYAFDTLKLNRIVAEHFGRNPASGRVMQKLGMTCEGTLRQQMRKWDRYEDGVVYGLLASEWRERRTGINSLND